MALISPDLLAALLRPGPGNPGQLTQALHFQRKALNGRFDFT
jgi:hypothetical protein